MPEINCALPASREQPDPRLQRGRAGVDVLARARCLEDIVQLRQSLVVPSEVVERLGRVDAHQERGERMAAPPTCLGRRRPGFAEHDGFPVVTRCHQPVHQTVDGSPWAHRRALLLFEREQQTPDDYVLLGSIRSRLQAHVESAKPRVLRGMPEQQAAQPPTPLGPSARVARTRAHLQRQPGTLRHEAKHQHRDAGGVQVVEHSRGDTPPLRHPARNEHGDRQPHDGTRAQTEQAYDPFTCH